MSTPLLRLLVGGSVLLAAAATTAPLTCAGGPPRPGVKAQCSLPVADAASKASPGGLPVQRRFELFLPTATARDAAQLPLLLHVHGQHVGPPTAGVASTAIRGFIFNRTAAAV